jgi:hypothetical protein
LQLWPIGGKSLLSNLARNPPPLFSCFAEHVIMLSDNMRQRRDPEFGTVVAKARLGQWQDECVQQLMRERAATAVPQAQQQYRFTPVAVVTNELRHCINLTATMQWIKQYCNATDNRAYRICARPSKSLASGVLEYIYSLRDDQCSKYLPLLHLARGMPVMITQNESVKLGFANGALATVLWIQFPEHTTFTQVDWIVVGDTVQVHVPSALPDVIYVQLHEPQQRRVQNLPNCFADRSGVLPLVLKKRSVAISAKHKPHGYPTTCTLALFPLVPAFAVTVYKLQGISLDSIVLANLYESTKGNQPHLAYVALSRARSKDGLFLLRTIATVLLVDKHVYQ